MVRERKKDNTAASFPGKRFLNSTLFHVLILFFTGLIVYSNTLHSPFQWDEHDYLMANPIVKDLHYFLAPSRAAGFEYYGGLQSRYIGYLSFALNYRLNGFNVAGYHLVNIAIHILNAIFLYLLVILTFRTPRLMHSRIREHAGQAALFTALLFVSHPLQTEAVTYVFQRFASLVALFYLVSIAMYAKGRLITAEAAEAACGKTYGRAIGFFLLSFVSAILAMKTKENAFTLPVVILLYDFFFFHGPARKRILYSAPLLFTMVIIPLTLTGMNRPFGEIVRAIGPATRGTEYLSRSSYLFPQFRVIVTYLRLLALPMNQNFDYAYPAFHSFFTAQVFSSFLLILSIAGVAAYMFYLSRSRAELRLISFGLLFFLVALSVESSIVPIPLLICEYRMYLPSAGMFLAVIASAYSLAERSGIRNMRTIAISLLSIVVMTFGVAAYCRNQTWGSRTSLWQDTAGKSPHSVTPHFALGNVYKSEGTLDRAVEQYDIALRLKPDDVDVRNNLGNTYRSKGEIDQAIKQYYMALRIKPDNAETHNNLGYAYKIEGMNDRALQEFLIALRLKPDLAEAHFNAGLLYIETGEVGRGRAELQKGLTIRPDDHAALQLLQSISR
jgi:tetratricopeptide (TPR) repeat protein